MIINAHTTSENSRSSSNPYRIETKLPKDSSRHCLIMADLGVCCHFSITICLMAHKIIFSIKEITPISLRRILHLWSNPDPPNSNKSIKILWSGTHHQTHLLRDSIPSSSPIIKTEREAPKLLHPTKLRDNSQQRVSVQSVELANRKMQVQTNEIMINHGCRQRKKRKKPPLS
jgi:hypothetical protein